MSMEHSYAFFVRCLHQRKDSSTLAGLLPIAIKRWHLSRTQIAASLIKCAVEFCPTNDPLIPLYIQVTIKAHHIYPSDILIACMQKWRPTSDSGSAQVKRHLVSLAQVVTSLTLCLPDHNLTRHQARVCLTLCARWLEVLFELAHMDENRVKSDQNASVTSAVVMCLTTVLNTDAARASLAKVAEEKEDVVNSLLRRVIKASSSTAPNHAAQLQSEAAKYPALIEPVRTSTGGQEAMELAALQFESTVIQMPIIATPRSMYYILCTKLANASTIDDASLCQFLNIRHPQDSQSMFDELLTAAFDVLTSNSPGSQDSCREQCCIFIYNKLPALLKSILGFSTLVRVAPDKPLRALSTRLNAAGEPEDLGVFHRFLHICTFHRLVGPVTLQTLSGDDASTTQVRGLYRVSDLLLQVNQNISNATRLVDELVKQDGNAAQISQVITKTVGTMCLTKDWSSLKDVADAFIGQPRAINTLAMFVRPEQFLGPVCRLLDEWSWDGHAESQHAYQEFGTLLLLIMTFKLRLGLSATQLGVTNCNGFTAQYLSDGRHQTPLTSLDPVANKLLGAWVDSLFFSEGISDEVTTNCSPAQFYRLLPTLLHQIVMALGKGTLTRDKLEGGLEYLLEPFLLPSLLSVFVWLAQYARRDPKNAYVVLKRLSKSPVDKESSKIHSTIMRMGGELFREEVGSLGGKEAEAPLLAVFDDMPAFSVNVQLSGAAAKPWKAESGSIKTFLARSVTDLMSEPQGQMGQPGLLAHAVGAGGPAATVQTLCALHVQMTSDAKINQTLDLISTIIAVTRLNGSSLRNALQLQYAELGTIVRKGKPLVAQALVQLHRQTELYFTALHPSTASTGSISLPSEDSIFVELKLQSGESVSKNVKSPATSMPAQEPVPQIANNIESMFDGDSMDIGRLDDYSGGQDDFLNFDSFELQELGDLDMSEF